MFGVMKLLGVIGFGTDEEQDWNLAYILRQEAEIPEIEVPTPRTSQVVRVCPAVYHVFQQGMRRFFGRFLPSIYHEFQ